MTDGDPGFKDAASGDYSLLKTSAAIDIGQNSAVKLQGGVVIEYDLAGNDDIQSKVLAFAFGLSAEIERNLISQRTKEALARKKAEGVILGRPRGRRSDPDKYKLSGKEILIKELLKNGISLRKIAKICKVDRNTLSRFITIKGLADV